MRARIINAVSALALVGLFFMVSYGWALLLAWVVPSWLMKNPWGVFESVLALVPFAGVVVRNVPPSAKIYGIRRSLIFSKSYAWWVTGIALAIITVVIAVAIAAGATLNEGERSLLGDMNWGNYCNLLMTGVCVLAYDIWLRKVAIDSQKSTESHS